MKVNPATPTRRARPELQALVGLFYPSRDVLGRFEEIAAGDLPPTAHELLWHDKHMTVAVESHHDCPVDVRVLDTHLTPTHYARQVVLTRRIDGLVVQFGIVRLNLDFLGADVRGEIEDQAEPLGRILIKHDVLRNVRLLSLWRITPGPALRKLFALDSPEACYGRTALIYCNGVPAVELVEIVTPD